MSEDWRPDSERIAASYDAPAQTDAQAGLMDSRRGRLTSAQGDSQRNSLVPPGGVPLNGQPAMVGAFQSLSLAIDRLEKVSAILDERTRAVRMDMPDGPAVARDSRGGTSPLAGAMNDLTARIECISNRLSLIHDTLEI